MLSIDYKHCTGCEACVQICPHGCISMKAGEFGSIFPTIDTGRCVNCHLCEKVCPIGKDVAVPIRQDVYAAVNKNRETLVQSTSGGAFSALATAVLHEGGVVYGACMDDFIVHHIRVESIEDLSKLRGSKYVQSRIDHAFRNVEQDLRNGREVLFSGTPCQVDGLKNYLGKEYEKLVTVDIVCHGVASQKYFDKFVDQLKDQHPGLKAILFRSKRFNGWSCVSGTLIVNDKGGKKDRPFYYHKNYYYKYFLDGDIYRQSCYSCKYANLNRPADITLGDFWGIEKMHLPLNTYHGCSLVIVSSESGRNLVNALTDLEKYSVPIEFAAKHNAQLLHPSALRDLRKKRLDEFETKTGKEINDLYQKNSKKDILKGNLKRMIPYSIKRLIRKVL